MSFTAVRHGVGFTMRIAVIGSTGQLGFDLCRSLPTDAHVALTHRDIEISSTESVQRCLTALHRRAPLTHVVNTAAYNFVDRAEEDAATAFRINALGPRTLAQWCRAHDVCLVHISTDYVFGLDRQRSVAYREDDPPGPLSVYAASKLAGEYFVRSIAPRHFVVRTCGLFGVAAVAGRGKGNFVETMLRLGRERPRVQVVADQRCTPTYTRDLAEAILLLLPTQRYGLYHITNGGSTSWFELARTIYQLAGLDTCVEPITTEAFGAAAARPRFSVLDCSRFERLTGHRMADWQDALRRYLREREGHDA
ncbi:MAG: dTDP-4-dehydrorhamnose reductase [Planctomycetota bacterium]|nr:MAG: dTDP-4-dehydrorhamnose reductase [Planctomycetota bacterium]